MADAAPSIDAREVATFAALAADWWDPNGSSRLLHRINPARLGYVREAAVTHFGLDPKARRALAGLSVLDVGCGAGLVCEPLARMGATVTGLDAAEASIAAARVHARQSGLSIDYRCTSVEALSAQRPGAYDLVTCLEVVEHVADVGSFLAALRTLLKPDGLLVFSTPNRTALSWAVMILGAERIVKAIPEGGHDHAKFLTPDELTQRLVAADLKVHDIAGLSWSPTRGFAITRDTAINYIGTATPA